MTLFAATLLVACLLVGTGSLQFFATPIAQSWFTGMLRSRTAAIVLLGIATAWFVWKLTQLGEPDFGNFKHWLIILFIGTSILSHFFLPDFLSVRGLCALLLLGADAVLDAAYMEPPASRLFLVGFTYLAIVLCMYLASLPYRLRDFFEWLYAQTLRSKTAGALLMAYGILLGIVAFTY